MPENIGETVKDIFTRTFSFILTFVLQWYWPLVFIGLMLLSIVVVARIIRKSYENRLLKSINKLNKYFLAKPYIMDDNLIEFNNKMKDVPSILRSNWQAFMLNREDGPTAYMNVENCIDKPLRSSSIEKHIGNFTHFTILLMLLSFICGIPYAFSGDALASPTVVEVLFYAMIVPAILLLLHTIFIIIFRARKNDIYSVLYENFPLFERNITKAVSTLPGYVDYEILFTKKEIKSGIPILQEYFDKRAIKEREEMERVRQSSMVGEKYNFDDLGVDGSLVLDRAMQESESFIKTRRRLQDEINSIETEKENYKRTFDSNSKDMQRKLQASRENLESLKRQQEESTNRVEINYFRKQLADEMKKQQQFEKDLEEATSKFNEEQVSLQKEMEKREREIEEKKDFVEKAMLLEFEHYANKLFKALIQKAADVSNEKLYALQQQNSDLRALINDLEGGVNDNVYDDSLDIVSPEEVATGNLYNIDGEGGQQNVDIVNLNDNPATEEQKQPEQPKEVPKPKKVEEQPKPVSPAQEEQIFVKDSDVSSQPQDDQNSQPQSVEQPAQDYANYQDTSYASADDTSGAEDANAYYGDYNDQAGEQPADNYYEQPVEETPYQEQYQDAPQDLPEEPASAQPDDYGQASSEAPYDAQDDAQGPEVVEFVQEAPAPAPEYAEQPEEEPYVAPEPEPEEKPVVSNKPQKASPKHEEETEDDDADDELAALQKQIEAENEKLKNEKDKLSEELSSTLSDIDEDEDEPKERKTRKSNASTAPKEPKQRAKSRRIDSSSSSKKKAEPKKSGRRGSASDDSDSGLDALNAEMQKLLDKAGK